MAFDMQPSSLDQFTPQAPIRLIIGHNDTGVVVQTETNILSVVGIVEIHSTFAERKGVDSIELNVSPSVLPRVQDTSFTGHRYLNQNVRIWEKGVNTSWPSTNQLPSDPQLLRVSFSIALPPVKRPASYIKEIGPVSLHYQVALVAKRHALFSDNISIKRDATIPPTIFNQLLLSTGTGRDLIRKKSANVTGNSGKGTISMSLRIPGLDLPFPLDTNIPFTVTLETRSAPVLRTVDREAAGDSDAFTPAIRTTVLHKVLNLRLVRHTSRQGPIATSGGSTYIHSQTASTLAPDLRVPGAMEADIHPPEWVPADELGSNLQTGGHWDQKGSWVQQIIVRSQIHLESSAITPTFRSEHESVNYVLELDGHLPLFQNAAFGNDIPNICVPIEVIRPSTPSIRAAVANTLVAPTISPVPSQLPGSQLSEEQRRARHRQLEEQIHRIQAEMETLGVSPDPLSRSGSSPASIPVVQDAIEPASTSGDTDDPPPPSYDAVVHHLT
ncbi:hypothetical protein FIBSPDRAFT_872968 [Athelia psychrophila]|uniref:Arrestin-like N-terminal domain-containing protein n=1 Tax=Athelia psychrophila TaxID=1759441 RepID=A0A165Z0L5_9AGAM|nr:hypothetical protein FIBSPDRAFT_872968 [Fibularhizoctonia sp. CBS 109695]